LGLHGVTKIGRIRPRCRSVARIAAQLAAQDVNLATQTLVGFHFPRYSLANTVLLARGLGLLSSTAA
jgi:hypothetical protein